MKKIIIVIFCLMGLVGCDKYLDEVPKNQISPERFYKSEADAIAGITGLYYNLMSGGAFNGYFFIDDYFGLTNDLTTPSRIVAGRIFFGYRWDQNTPAVRSIWNTLYSTINDANVFIERVSIADLDDSVKRELLAEAIFLRGFIYYYLTAMYGDVPYITKATNDNVSYGENTTMARSSADGIRAKIIEELADIENDLPGNIRNDYPQRATRWAAKTLKLNMYLWLEDYQNAVATAQDIINNSNHRLLTNYEDIFDPDNEFNDEIIFQFDYIYRDFPTMRNSTFQPRTQDENQEDGPLPAYFNGYNNHTVFQSVSRLYPENDLRRKSNVYNELDNGIKLKFSYLRKQWRINEARENSGLNYKFFRFADILLNLSEAENELNGPTELAYSGINQVRSRAGIPILSGLNKTELREAIKLERSLELIGEGTYRKMDLSRWGETEKALNERLSLEQNEENPNSTHINNLQYVLQTYAPYKDLLPIPFEEIRLNPNLTQNEGY